MGRSVDVARPEVLADRYRLIRVLKSGAGVDTLLAESTSDSAPAVVKRTAENSVSPALRVRLAHEAEVLSRLTSPHGETYLLDHGTHDGWIWFAQRFQPGQTLAARLAAGPLDLAGTLTVARCVLSALVQAHEAGVVHRDVKPANILVDGQETVLSASLIDFGLARSPALDPSLRDDAVGSARYCSPEQAGLLDLPVDSRSDLYALGVTLYECLTGAPLFDAPDIRGVLRLKLHDVGDAVYTACQGAPRAVSEVLARLVRTNPDDRYQSASGALADVEDISRAVERGVTEPTIVVGRHDRRASIAEPGFVGRTSEVAALSAQLDRTARGLGGVLLVEGESGAGKSRLLEELTRLARDRGMTVLRGQAEDQTAQRPFQIFDGVAAGVVEMASGDVRYRDTLRERLAGHTDTLLAVSPRMSGVLSGSDADPMPEEYARTRSVTALSSLLDALGDERTPVVVILDDAQWAQAMTADVLADWSTARAGSRWALVVAAFRSEEVTEASPLRSIDGSSTLRIDALNGREISDLVSSMAGPVPPEATAAVIRLAGGNAFMAQAVLMGMVESGAMVSSQSGWAVDEALLAGVETSRQAALVLTRRLDLLPPAAKELLQAGAVLGKTFDLPLAASLSELSPGDVAAARIDLAGRRILWVDQDSDSARFLHDKLREAVLTAMGDERRRTLHLRAAMSFSGEASAFDLAYHFDAAGRPDDALPHAMVAAERSRAQHALDDAELYYRIAMKADPDRSVSRRLREGLGEVLALMGRYAEAEEELSAAAEAADDSVSRAAITGKLGEVAFRRGDQARACAQLENALHQLGCWVPRNGAGFVVGALWEVVVQVLHTVFPRLAARKGSTASYPQKLAMRFYSRLAYAYWFRKGRFPCLWAHLREMNLAERFGPSAELAQAYSEHAPVMTMLPWFSRGIDYSLRSLSIRKELGDLWGQGQSLSFYGVVLYAASRYEESIQACLEAVRLLALTGDQWEINTASWHVAFSQYRLGNLAEAANRAAEVHRRATRIGDLSSAGIALSAWSRASGGRIPLEAAEIVSRAQNEDRHTATELSMADAVRLLTERRPAEAARVLEDAWSGVRADGLRQEYVAPVPAWWATALRAEADSLPEGHAGSDELRHRQLKVARRATRLAFSYRNNAPHALRELALAEAATGRPRRARRHLERSIAVASDHGARWEEACSRVEWGRLGMALGWPGAKQALEEGTAGVESLAIGDQDPVDDAPEPTLSLTARFEVLLETGRVLAAAASTEAVYAAVESAGAELLGAERCHVLEVSRRDFAGLVTISGEQLGGLSASAVRDAVETGAVVVREPSEGTAVADSLVLAGVKSLLCAPIRCEGEVVACFYATHKEIGGLFGEEEQHLATFVSALAGAALEHLSGSANRYRALVERSSDATFLNATDGSTIYASPAAVNILGWSPDEMTGRTNMERVHPNDVRKATKAFQLVAGSPGASSRAEYRVQHSDGSWRTVEVSYTNRVHDPAVGAVVVNIHDVTERHEAQQHLARVAEQFRLAFDNAPIGVALISQRPENAGRFLRVNDALARMMGYTREEMEEMTVKALTHPEDYPGDVAATRRFESNEADSYHAEKRYSHADGHWVWLNLHSGLIRDEFGDPDYVVAQMVDITSKKEADEALKRQAFTDPLTRLDNRWLFLDRLPQSLARARRRGTHLGIFYLDLDNFKVINDSHGHSAGDRVLSEIAARLRSITREEDILARLGGDEFVLVVDDLEQRDEVKGIAARIEEVLHVPIQVTPEIDVRVTTSIGVTVAGLEDDAQSLLRDADIALYRAKDRGKARYEVFGEHLRLAALERERTERELRAAIDDDRMVLHFQPILDLATGLPVAVESLIRYRSPDGSVVPPMRFMKVAEETGLIVTLGSWVLRESCLALPRLRELSGNPDLRIGVNVSPRQLSTSAFAETVASIIEEAGADPQAVALEITEHALIDMMEPVRPCLEQLRRVGCRIGIDDFGTGYSSLVFLTSLPLDFLKIDQTFVRGLGTNDDDEAIVKALIGLAGALGLRTVAEGVETEEQAERLRSFACEQAQGFLYSKPLPLDEVFR